MTVELPEQRLAGIARAQFGAFSRAQARQVGMSEREIERRLASGAWQPLHPRIYAAASSRRSRPLMATAARLYAGDAAYFSHLSAARLLGFDVGPVDSAHWLTVPVSSVRRKRPGVEITRSRHVTGWTSVAHGQPVMSLARLPIDLAACLDETVLRRALHDIVASQRVSVEEILAAAEGLGGRAGLALLRRVTDEYDPAYESALEDEANRVFVAGGLDFERQLEIWDGPFLVARLDFADPSAKLAVEVDGEKWHSSRAAREYDRRRDREVTRRGWTVLRFGTDEVRRRPAAMLSEVLAVRLALLERAA